MTDETETQTPWPDAVRRLQWHLYSRDIEPHREALMAHCIGLVGDRQRAADLLQETLLRGFEVVSQLHRGLDNPAAFLKRVARNLFIDQHRRSRRLEPVAKYSDVDAAADPARARQISESLEQLAQRLPEVELQAFVLSELCGFTASEAAGQLNKSPGAVKMALSRARKRLRESFSD